MAQTPAIRYGTVMDIAMTLATGPLAPLLRDGDLPGPMNLNRLADFGTLSNSTVPMPIRCRIRPRCMAVPPSSRP